MHDDAEPGSVSLRPGDRNVRGRGFFAVFKNDAPLPGAELACIGAFRDENFIFLFFFEARMGQLIREIAVIGHQDQSFGFEIEAADDEKRLGIGDKLIDGLARVVIGAVGQDETRLVDGDVDFFGFLKINRNSVDADLVPIRIDLHPEDCGFAVDGNALGRDKFLAFAPGAEAGSR